MAEQNSYDFWTRYSNLCLKCKVCPLKSVIKHMKGTTLCCPVERIRSEHWQFLLSALSIDNSLTKVCFKSELPHLDDQKELWKKRRRRNNESYPIPYGYSAHNISDICKYSARLLTVSQTLQKLTIDNLPVTEEDAAHLAEGLKSSYIKEFAFKNYAYDDEVIAIVCRGLWDSKVSSVDFTACHLSIAGLKSVIQVIKTHKERRMVAMFPDTLRYRLPVFEEMIGLFRVNLTGNLIRDRGVYLLCNAISDDHWIQALDLQCCGIRDEGALMLLKQIIENNVMQLVDLRLNDIDREIIEQISMQLEVNSFGKNQCVELLPLWKPSFLTRKTLPARKSKAKPKVLKKYSHAKVVKKELKKISENASVQTVDNSEILRLKERIRTLEIRLLQELSEKHSIMEDLEKTKMLNEELRHEVKKLSVFDDVILIDQETYCEIKHVFEKFQRFLRLMKDYGLWGLVSTIGVAEYENTKLKAVPSDSKICTVEELCSVDSHPPNGPVLRSVARCCSCRKPECVSNQKPEKENHGSNINHNQKTAQDKSQLKNIVDKAKVTKVFKELRETYTNCDFAKQLPTVPPPVTRNLSSDESPPGLKPVAKPIFRNNAEIPDRFKQIKTRQDLYDAVKCEMERIECVCRFHKIQQSPESPNSNHPPNKNQNTACVKSHLKNVSSQTATTDLINDHKKQKLNPSVLSESKSSHSSLRTGPIYTSFRRKKSPDCFPSTMQEAISLVSREWERHVKKKSPKSKAERPRPSASEIWQGSDVVDPEYFKALVSSKKSESEKILQTTKKDPAPKEDSSSTLTNIPDISSKTSVISTFTEADPSVANSIESSACENEIKIKSSQTPSSKGNSEKSYLESVTDASTDKDVKSISENEIYESDVKSESVTSKNSNKSSKNKKGGNNSGGSKNSLSNDCSNSKKGQKQKKLSNQNSASGDGDKFQKDNVSISSVPSLSDITTVSSHSLNTDSVMDQLSEKGLS